jgi:membrane peptidoglycan carboxypeptidase
VKQLNPILTGVVERGTGKLGALPGYAVAGKTGTAQKVEHGGYSHSKVLASFVGYVPAEAPQLAILVMVDEPQIAKWGGQAAAPVFRRVAEQAVHYLQIPSRQAQPFTLEAPSGHTTSLLPGDQSPTHLALSTVPRAEQDRRPSRQE